MITRGGLMIAVMSALLFGLAVGLLGGVAYSSFILGGTPGFLHAPRPGRWGHGPMAGPGPMPGPGLMMRRLESDLGLSETQRRRIEDVIERSRSEFGAVRDSTHARLARELTPQQLERWHQMERRPPMLDAMPPRDPHERDEGRP